MIWGWLNNWILFHMECLVWVRDIDRWWIITERERRFQINTSTWKISEKHSQVSWWSIRSAEKVTGCNRPSLQNLCTSRTMKRAGKIVADPSHPELFESLPSGRRPRSIRTKNSRHKNSFFPTSASLINKAQDPHWHRLYSPLTLH